MPAEPLTGNQRVLIIDQSADSRDVFKTVLERRGVATRGAAGYAAAAGEIREFCPQVVVVDVESAGLDPRQLQHQCRAAADPPDVTWVMIGNLPTSASADDHSYFVRKPYRYGPLLRKIEQLAHAATHHATT